MTPCSCTWCQILPKIPPCEVKHMLKRVLNLENAIRDMLNADSTEECQVCLLAFRILLDKV